MAIDFQPMTQSSNIDFQPIEGQSESKPTNIPSKVLAASGSSARGMVEGMGQVLSAPGNILSAAIQGGLHLLDKAGIVPDSMYQNYKSTSAESRKTISDLGSKALDTIFKPAEQDIQANPGISKVSNIVGQGVGGSIVAGGLVGKLGSSLNPSLGGALNQGAQGLLMGAGANPNNPVLGGAIGAAVGAPLGAVAGHFSRSAEIINDKIDDATRIGLSPLSTAGLKSIKGALDNNGKELTTEEVERQTKQVLQTKLNSVAPKVDITQKPTDIITNLASSNYPKVIKEQNALYAPLHEAEVQIETPKLSSIMSTITDKTAQRNLPDPLKANSTLDDMLNYRRQVSKAINSAESAVKTDSNVTFKTLDQLHTVKKAITEDLNFTASKVGLGDQLQKADAFHINQVKPFEVYNTQSGKLVSPEDMTDTWTRASKLLRPRLPNLTAMGQVASTLGPEGKQVFGYAYLQQAIERSMNVDGRIFPTKITGELNKLQNSGLAEHILTPELKEAFNGMRSIAEGALKTTRGMDSKSSGIIMNFINKLTHSSGGITILRALGSKTTPLANIKNTVTQILTNVLEQQGSQQGVQSQDQQ